MKTLSGVYGQESGLRGRCAIRRRAIGPITDRLARLGVRSEIDEVNIPDRKLKDTEFIATQLEKAL